MLLLVDARMETQINVQLLFYNILTDLKKRRKILIQFLYMVVTSKLRYLLTDLELLILHSKEYLHILLRLVPYKLYQKFSS